MQTVSLYLRGRHADGKTLEQLIAGQTALMNHTQKSGGLELPTLVPLSLSLLLYAAAADPEIDWLPAEQIARPTPIRDTRTGNLGGAPVPRCVAGGQAPPAQVLTSQATGLTRVRGGCRYTYAGRTGIASASPSATTPVLSSVTGSVSRAVDRHYEPHWYGLGDPAADHVADGQDHDVEHRLVGEEMVAVTAGGLDRSGHDD